MSKIILKESELRKLVREAINNELVVFNSKVAYSREQRQLYAEFSDFLRGNGVNNAGVRDYGNGSYCISIPTSEYNHQVFDLANKYAEKRGMWVRTDDYPATTYLHLEKR
jgi:hypothetical protein